MPIVSIVISSYNYARFLRQAIDSALNQTWSGTQVVVVDDGSADESPSIIGSYGERITALLTANGGQAHAWNLGFAASVGDVIIFLDSDDVLLPIVAERAIGELRDGRVHVHWPLTEIDAGGVPTGRTVPAYPLWTTASRDRLLRYGPGQIRTVPSSGNAWSRSFLGQVLPMPEAEYRTCPDDYLTLLAPLYGDVGHVAEQLSLYRTHGNNNMQDLRLDEKRRLYRLRERVLLEQAAARGVEASAARWLTDDTDWLDAIADVRRTWSAIGDGERIILVDQDEFRAELSDRRLSPFVERDGTYWGPPASDRQAVDELERLRRAGATMLVVAWPAFWWLDHYSGLANHLRTRYRLVRNDERAVAFDLR